MSSCGTCTTNLIGEGGGPPPMLPPAPPMSDEESPDDSEVSAKTSDDEILVPLVEDGIGEGGGEESDAEAGDIIEPLGPGGELPLGAVVAAPAPAAPAAPADPVLDALMLEKPAWALGVELAEVCRHANTKCVLCGNKIDKLTVRFKYWTHKSVSRFIHCTCFNDVPLAYKAHSVLSFRYQRDMLFGPDTVAVDAAIDAALAM